MKRKTYIIPQTETNVIDYSEGLMQETSWSADGGGLLIPIIHDGNPDKPDPGEDPYGMAKEEAKGNTFGPWEE
jgi:hypothetical protein